MQCRGDGVLDNGLSCVRRRKQAVVAHVQYGPNSSDVAGKSKDLKPAYRHTFSPTRLQELPRWRIWKVLTTVLIRRAIGWQVHIELSPWDVVRNSHRYR